MKRCQQKFPTSISPFHSLCPSFLFIHLISYFGLFISTYLFDLCMLRNPDLIKTLIFILLCSVFAGLWCFLFVNTYLPQIVRGIIPSVVCNTCKFISNENIVKTQINHEERIVYHIDVVLTCRISLWMTFGMQQVDSLRVYQCSQILPLNQGQEAPFWRLSSNF